MDFTNYTIVGQSSTNCNDLIKECYNSCYESRLNLSQGLGDKFELVLTIYVIFILYMIISHKIVKNDYWREFVNDRIKFALWITSIYILLIIYVF